MTGVPLCFPLLADVRSIGTVSEQQICRLGSQRWSVPISIAISL